MLFSPLAKDEVSGLDSDPNLGWRPELQWQPQSLPAAQADAVSRLPADFCNIRSWACPPNDRLRLSRADVEWLIERNGGPVQWGDDRRGHAGLDLRGADLST